MLAKLEELKKQEEERKRLEELEAEKLRQETLRLEAQRAEGTLCLFSCHHVHLFDPISCFAVQRRDWPKFEKKRKSARPKNCV